MLSINWIILIVFQIPAGGVSAAYFPIEPLETGDLKVNLSAWTHTGISDGIVKELKVEVIIPLESAYDTLVFYLSKPTHNCSKGPDLSKSIITMADF